MKSLIQVLITRAKNVYEEVNGLTPNTDITNWSFEDLTYQAQELLKVVQTIETLRRAKELAPESQLIYQLLNLREDIYKKYKDEDLDDKLLELAQDFSIELGVDMAEVINMKQKVEINYGNKNR